MIDLDHALSLGRQAKGLGISRSGVHYIPRPTLDADLAIMRRIGELHLEYPFVGGRMLKGLFKAEGYEAGGHHVSTPMKGMAIAALFRRLNTSKPARGTELIPTPNDADLRRGFTRGRHRVAMMKTRDVSQ